MTLPRIPSLACERGVVAPATAVMLAVLVGMVGLVTDTSVWYAQRRQLQAATDAAALAAAAYAHDATRARRAADAVLTANGLDPAGAVLTFATGQYCDQEALGQRFRADCVAAPGEADDAVRIETGLGTPLFLSRLFTAAGTNARRISTVATATQVDQAGLQAGTGLVSVNDGLANELLSQLTGSRIALTGVQYEGLLKSDVDALTFLDALATQAGVTAGTYGQLVQTNVGVRQVIAAQIAALARQSQVADVAAAIAGLETLRSQIAGNPAIALGTLFDLGMWRTQQVGQSTSTSALRASLNLMQLTSFTLQLANGANAAAIPPSTVGVPGIASVRIAATAIEPPVRSRFAFGPSGVSVHTAQVRIKLEASLVAGVSTIPIYIEVAEGNATLGEIACDGDPTADTQVSVRATSGLADVYLGAPRLSVMNNFSERVTIARIDPAPLADLGLIKLTAKAHVPLGEGAGTLLFKQPGQAGGSGIGIGIIGRPASDALPAIAPVPASVGTRRYADPLLTGLLGDLTLTATLLGAPVTLNAGQLRTVTGTLSPLLAGLDGVVDGLLATLGVQLGYADVAVTGVRCGVPVLVS